MSWNIKKLPKNVCPITLLRRSYECTHGLAGLNSDVLTWGSHEVKRLVYFQSVSCNDHKTIQVPAKSVAAELKACFMSTLSRKRAMQQHLSPLVSPALHSNTLDQLPKLRLTIMLPSIAVTLIILNHSVSCNSAISCIALWNFQLNFVPKSPLLPCWISHYHDIKR